MAKTEQNYFDEYSEDKPIVDDEKQYDENDLPIDDEVEQETTEENQDDTTDETEEEVEQETTEENQDDTTDETEEEEVEQETTEDKPLTLDEIKEQIRKEIEDKESLKHQEEQNKLAEQKRLKDEEEFNKPFDENSVLTDADRKVLDDLKELNPEVLDAFNVVEKRNKAAYEHQLKKNTEILRKEMDKKLIPLMQEFEKQQQSYLRTTMLSVHPDIDTIANDLVVWIEGQPANMKQGYINAANGSVEEKIALVNTYKKINGIVSQKETPPKKDNTKEKQDIINKQKTDAKNKMKPVKSTGEGSKRSIDDLTEEELFDMYSK